MAGVVDVCLIPEVNFVLDGEHGLMAYLHRLLAEKGHCVICIAEGAGQVLPLPLPCPAAVLTCPSLPALPHPLVTQCFFSAVLVCIIPLPCTQVQHLVRYGDVTVTVTVAVIPPHAHLYMPQSTFELRMYDGCMGTVPATAPPGLLLGARTDAYGLSATCVYIFI